MIDKGIANHRHDRPEQAGQPQPVIMKCPLLNAQICPRWGAKRYAQQNPLLGLI